MKGNAQKLIQRHQSLKNTPERANLENTCRDIEEFIRPGRGDFTGYQDKGRRSSPRRFEDTAIRACNNFQAGMYGMGTSKANRWFTLRTQGGQENEDLGVARWLEHVDEVVSGYLQNPTCQFYRHLKPFYGDLGAFGTACLYSHEPMPGKLVFKSVSLANLVFSEDALGVIDTAMETYTLSAIAAHRRFNRNGIKCRQAAKLHEKQPFMLLNFLHVVEVNDDIRPQQHLSPLSKPSLSHHINLDTQEVCEFGGFLEFPYHIARWSQEPGGVYGRGIGFDIISTVMGLNAMKRSNLKAAQNIADPALLMPDEGVFGGRIRTHPGDHVYGGVSQEGRPLVYPLQTGGNVPVAMEMMNQERAEVRNAFYFDLMQLAQRANMTATEVVQRQEEKLRLLGPHLGLLESDLLEPVIRRVSNWAIRNGFIAAPPAELASDVEIEFVSPLALAQKMADATAIQRAVAFAGQVGAFAPDALLKVNANKAVEETFRSLGAPTSILLSDEEVALIKEQQQQAQAAQAGAAMAQQGADVLLKLAQADKAAREAGPNGTLAQMLDGGGTAG